MRSPTIGLPDDDDSWLRSRHLAGALLAWPRSPGFIQYLFPPLLTLSAIPFFLLGLVLIYLFAFRVHWFPLFGGYTPAPSPH